jgi:hypothetical protein
LLIGGKRSRREAGTWWWMPIAVLLIAIALEGFSFRTAVTESNHVRGKRSWTEFVRTAKAPELPVILLEDLAALVGLVFALFGVGMTLVTDNGVWDAAGTAAPSTPSPGGNRTTEARTLRDE